MTKRIARLTLLAGLAAWVDPQAASAHVTLERTEAPAGRYHKAVLQVTHGCKGSPTVALRVRLPEGVTSVKPQPKPGWTIRVTRTPEAPDGSPATVSEVAWSGGPLADEHFDEFRLMMKLPDRPGATLYLPVVQECAQGLQQWTHVPEAGRSAGQADAPALLLTPGP